MTNPWPNTECEKVASFYTIFLRILFIFYFIFITQVFEFRNVPYAYVGDNRLKGL